MYIQKLIISAKEEIINLGNVSLFLSSIATCSMFFGYCYQISESCLLEKVLIVVNFLSFKNFDIYVQIIIILFYTL